MTGSDHIKGDLARLYRDTIRRHAAEPAGFRQNIAATHRHEEYNPLCGDRVEIQLRVAAGSIEAAAFDGEACTICLASASMLCSLAPGLEVTALLQLAEALHRALDESVEAAPAAIGLDDDLEETRLKPPPHPGQHLHKQLHPLLGVRPYPSRVRCATLPWTAAASALSD